MIQNSEFSNVNYFILNIINHYPCSNYREIIFFNFRGKEKGIRQGYMGHLINIANNIVTQREKSNVLDSFLKANLSPDCLNKWDSLASNQLAEINKTHKIYLVFMIRFFLFFLYRN